MTPLGLTRALDRTPRATNVIENPVGSVDGSTRRVKRWCGGQRIPRWIASALLETERPLPARPGATATRDTESARWPRWLRYATNPDSQADCRAAAWTAITRRSCGPPCA